MKIILLFLSISIGIYFLLDYFNNQDKESVASEIGKNNDRLNDLPVKTAISNETRKNPKVTNQSTDVNMGAVDYSKALDNIKITTLSICRYNSNDFEKKLESNDLFNGSSEKQLFAKNELIKKCKYWYDYIYSLTDQEIDNLENNRQSIEEQNKHFLTNTDIFVKTKANDAKGIMQTGGDGSLLTVGALMYLMQNDANFIKVIASQLGTEDLSYISNSKIFVPFLYICRVNPSDCSSNSWQMLSTCTTNESVCGLNFIDYARSLLTANQFNDYMNIVEIIIRLVKNEFFRL